MSKYWNVKASSIAWCGVSHTFCVKTPDKYTEEMVEEYLPLIMAGEEAMVDYLDEDELEDEDSCLVSMYVEPWDTEVESPDLQNWATNFEITE